MSLAFPQPTVTHPQICNRPQIYKIILTGKSSGGIIDCKLARWDGPREWGDISLSTPHPEKSISLSD